MNNADIEHGDSNKRMSYEALKSAMKLAEVYIDEHPSQDWRLSNYPDLRKLPDPIYFNYADSLGSLPQTTHLYVLAKCRQEYLVIHPTAITSDTVKHNDLLTVEIWRLLKEIRTRENYTNSIDPPEAESQQVVRGRVGNALQLLLAFFRALMKL